MKKGVIVLGEALIDFIPTDETNAIYHKSPGGAPANVAVGLARLGARSTFIGKVGDDVLGRFLEETLRHYNVGIEQMQFTAAVRTGFTFVTNEENGERSFTFYINPSADRFLESSEINKEAFKKHKIFHFGSISMIDNPAKEATHYAVKLAKGNGMIISYDPNLRLSLWKSADIARTTITSMFKETDILKVSKEELEFVTGEKTVDKGVRTLARYRIPLIIVTLGAGGCFVYTSEGNQHVPSMKVKAVDTTGAGDAFVSGILYALTHYGGAIGKLSLQKAVEMAKFASISGALATSRKGAMTALPTRIEVAKYVPKD